MTSKGGNDSIRARLRLWLVRRLLNRLRTTRDITRFATRRYAQRVALVDATRMLTYAALGDRVLRLAADWRARGIGVGDGVFTRLPDGIEQIEVRLAGAECGAVLTSLSLHLNTDQIVAAAREIGPKLLVHAPADAELAARIALALPGLSLLALGADYEAAIAAGRPVLNTAPVDPEAPGALGFTSGTTGAPKILTATHGAFLTSLRLMIDNVGIGRPQGGPDTTLVGIPLSGAGSGVVLPTLLAGGTLVIPPRYEAGTLLEHIERRRATRLFTTPSLLIDILDHPDLDRRDLSSLRNIIYGTELMPAAKLEEALRRFGPILQQGYGSAEVLPPVAMLQPHEHMVDGRPAPRAVLRSTGKVVPTVTIRIIDEAGRDLPRGEIGQVLVKSPTLFRGYWKRPDLSASTIRDGFLYTGDTGTVSADGYLTLLGRKPDLVRRDGRVIYPRLVEEALHDHPAVKEASLVQVGERVVMAVSLRRAWRDLPPEHGWNDEFQRHLATQVEPWQLPDTFEVFDELPRSPLGKVLRREVRATLEAGAQPA